MRMVVTKETGNAKKGVKMEEDIYKIGVKIYFVIEAGNLTLDQVLECDKPFREAIEIFNGCRDHVSSSTAPGGHLDKEEMSKRLQEAGRLGKETASQLKQMLSPFLTAKNLNRIDDVLSYWGDPDVLL